MDCNINVYVNVTYVFPFQTTTVVLESLMLGLHAHVCICWVFWPLQTMDQLWPFDVMLPSYTFPVVCMTIEMLTVS